MSHVLLLGTGVVGHAHPAWMTTSDIDASLPPKSLSENRLAHVDSTFDGNER